METNNSPDETPQVNDAPGKRDREYGMCEDPLVAERTGARGIEFNRQIQEGFSDRSIARVYEFIGQYRPGTPTGIRRPLRGSYNVIFCVDFTDGSALLRVVVPGNTVFPDEKVRNEVATMRYIEKMTSIPVPHIYHWGTAAENPLGLGPFIIMDYIPHAQSLSDFLNDPTNEDPKRRYLDLHAPKDKLERMYRQVADIVLQLSKLEMSQLGSLREHGDSFVVGGRPFTQEMNDLVVQGGVPPSIFPPEDTTYSTSDEWYAALADLHVAHLAFQHNDAIVSADDCRDKFIARHLFRQQARRGKLLEADQRPRKRQGKETFRLWIDDFRPHNILVDADLNIVGVIDWEWAYFAPESYVHDPPWWLLLTRPEFWPGTVLDFRDRFADALDVFLGVLRSREDAVLPTGAKEEEEAWSIDQHMEALGLGADEMRLSDRMRRSWDSGAIWANYAARRCYGFEPVFWEFLDERFFGKNAEGGYEGRIHLLSNSAKKRMELFVERKMEESKEEKIVDWDPDEAKSHLVEILAHFD